MINNRHKPIYCGFRYPAQCIFIEVVTTAYNMPYSILYLHTTLYPVDDYAVLNMTQRYL